MFFLIYILTSCKFLMVLEIGLLFHFSFTVFVFTGAIKYRIHPLLQNFKFATKRDSAGGNVDDDTQRWTSSRMRVPRGLSLRVRRHRRGFDIPRDPMDDTSSSSYIQMASWMG